MSKTQRIEKLPIFSEEGGIGFDLLDAVNKINKIIEFIQPKEVLEYAFEPTNQYSKIDENLSVTPQIDQYTVDKILETLRMETVLDNQQYYAGYKLATKLVESFKN